MNFRGKTFSSKKTKLKEDIELFFEQYYFDVQGINPTFASLDEAYIARVLTKLAVGSATVWWSLLEIKDFIQLRSSASKIRKSSHGVS